MNKCPTCRGFKSISPLGGIVKTCPKCSGIGYIETEQDNDIEPKQLNPIASCTIIEQQSKPIKLDKRSKQYRAMVGR